MAWMKKKKSWFNWVYLLCREMLSKIMAMKIKKIPSDVYDQMKFSVSKWTWSNQKLPKFGCCFFKCFSSSVVFKQSVV